MCGILGFYYNNSINISDNFFLNNLKQLNRRGPDNLDFINYGINNHKLTLGHTRLSILDVSNLGKQSYEFLNELLTITSYTRYSKEFTEFFTKLMGILPPRN